jgi:hypothetical protein
VEDRPTAAELLDTIGGLLQDEVLPVVSGPLQHKVRVAANLCAILAREARLGPEMARHERARLAELLGHDGPLDELNAELSERLRTADDAFLAATLPVLRECVVAKLGIDKPGYAAWEHG